MSGIIKFIHNDGAERKVIVVIPSETSIHEIVQSFRSFLLAITFHSDTVDGALGSQDDK